MAEGYKVYGPDSLRISASDMNRRGTDLATVMAANDSPGVPFAAAGGIGSGRTAAITPDTTVIPLRDFQILNYQAADKSALVVIGDWVRDGAYLQAVETATTSFLSGAGGPGVDLVTLTIPPSATVGSCSIVANTSGDSGYYFDVVSRAAADPVGGESKSGETSIWIGDITYNANEFIHEINQGHIGARVDTSPTPKPPSWPYMVGADSVRFELFTIANKVPTIGGTAINDPSQPTLTLTGTNGFVYAKVSFSAYNVFTTVELAAGAAIPGDSIPSTSGAGYFYIATHAYYSYDAGGNTLYTTRPSYWSSLNPLFCQESMVHQW